MGDNVEAEMVDTIFEDAADTPVSRDELWAREKGNKEEGTIGGLHANVRMNVRKAQEHRVGYMIASHY